MRRVRATQPTTSRRPLPTNVYLKSDDNRDGLAADRRTPTPRTLRGAPSEDNNHVDRLWRRLSVPSPRVLGLGLQYRMGFCLQRCGNQAHSNLGYCLNSWINRRGHKAAVRPGPAWPRRHKQRASATLFRSEFYQLFGQRARLLRPALAAQSRRGYKAAVHPGPDWPRRHKQRASATFYSEICRMAELVGRDVELIGPGFMALRQPLRRSGFLEPEANSRSKTKSKHSSTQAARSSRHGDCLERTPPTTAFEWFFPSRFPTRHHTHLPGTYGWLLEPRIQVPI